MGGFRSLTSIQSGGAAVASLHSQTPSHYFLSDCSAASAIKEEDLKVIFHNDRQK